MLHQLIVLYRDEIIRRCRAANAAGSDRALPGTDRIDHGVPVLLDELVDTLRRGLSTSPDICRSALRHGHELLLQGFTLSQVVHAYGDLRQSIADLAEEAHSPITPAELRILNRSLDDAIASAVSEYEREHGERIVDREAARGSERLGFLAHELRNFISTAIIAFEVLKTGNVGLAGSTGGVLQRSLMNSGALIARSLAEVRLTNAVQHPERFLINEFIAELGPAASLEAEAKGITLAITTVERGISVEADRQVLAAVVGNLLQNAFKFTRPRSTVSLRVGTSRTRVLIEVEDECGGLPGGDVNDLFRPFEQRSADRTGLGLGLAFCRWGVEANNGRIFARSLPDHGCVFTVDLPRLPALALAMGG